MPDDGLPDDALLKRLAANYGEAFVAGVAAELAEARRQVEQGLAEESVVVWRIHERFTYQMHDLGEFMNGLLQRYTQWHNRRHSRTGRLWEDGFKSVIVEDGVAARTMAAYIDLNPVRAGMVKDPADTAGAVTARRLVADQRATARRRGRDGLGHGERSREWRLTRGCGPARCRGPIENC